MSHNRRPCKSSPQQSTRRREAVRCRLPTQCRPHLEPLEDRLTPANHVWQGAFSSLWSDARNWSSGGSPDGDTVATLEFPSSNVARFTSPHDRPETVNILQMVLHSDGYTLNGGPIARLVLIQSDTNGHNTIDFQAISL